MATYLLTWNPNRWAWTDLRTAVAQTANGRPWTGNWSTGNTTRVSPGDRVFLLRQGEEPRGIMAAGRAESSVFSQPHWDAERSRAGETAHFVTARFDLVLDPFDNPPLQIEGNPALHGVNPTPAASGFSVDTQAAGALEVEWARHIAAARPARFVVGKAYTREDVKRALGLEPTRGGKWDTGYPNHNGESFLFPNLGTARTGHDYGNKWQGTRLVWYGRTGSKRDHSSIRSLTAPGARVHLFTRGRDRDPFTYHGLVQCVGEPSNDTPVQVVWEPVAASPDQDAVPPKRRAQGRGLSEGKKNAIENWAVRRAIESLPKLNLRDVGSAESWDLEGVDGGLPLRIEVKGSQLPLNGITLTHNEVVNAREARDLGGHRLILVVVERIHLDPGEGQDVWIPSGGIVRILDPWVIEEDSLVPTQWRYELRD